MRKENLVEEISDVFEGRFDSLSHLGPYRVDDL